MNRGATLTELAAVLGVVAITLGIAIPGLAGPLDNLAVDRAAYTIAAAHGRARMTSILESREALLWIRADSLAIAVVLGADTAIRWQTEGPRADRVSLTGPTRPLVFSPVGITTGVSNGTWVLRRGNARKDVIISRLGRIRFEP